MAQASRSVDRPNVFGRLTHYVRDVRGELRRVVWPNRKEVVNSSIIVVVTLVFFIVFTYFADTLSTWIVEAIASLRG